ncbi:MAG TPA: hypothetical protein VHQ91_09405 [Geminicoccaceae bacterium]|nr:hypothetical protein [Geminicoccaceae bacterium]
MSAATRAEAPGQRRAGRPGSLKRGGLRALMLAIGLAALLALLTIATFAYLPRYQADGHSVLDNTDFRDGFRGWRTAGLVTLDEAEVGHAILQNHGPQREVYLRRTISLPPGPISLRLSTDAATSGVEQGPEPWQTARVYLMPGTPAGTGLREDEKTLASLVGTAPRRHFEAVFDFVGASEVTLGIELPTSGRIEIANLDLTIVDERTSFRLAAALLVCGWSLLAFRVASGVYRGVRLPLVRQWLVGVLSVLVAGLFVPVVLRRELIDRLATGFGMPMPYPDAFGHALVFALLALLVRIGRPRVPLLVHLACWLLVGAAVEVLRLFAPDRSPDAASWLVSAIGTVLGLAVAEIGLWLRRCVERFGSATRPPPPMD